MILFSSLLRLHASRRSVLVSRNVIMSDLVLIPQSDYKRLCDELNAELPKSLKVMNLLLTQMEALSETKCYAKVIGSKVDAKLVVVKVHDVKFKKHDLDQDFIVFLTSQDQLSKLMENKAVMDFKKLILFRGIDVDYIDWFSMASRRHGGHLRLATTGYIIYQLENQSKLTTSLPDDVEIAPITEEGHIHMVRISWLYREMMTMEEFKHEILSNITVGLYIPAPRSRQSYHQDVTRHLVSWAVCDINGIITLVSTVSEHQHKGFANMVISNLSRQILSSGRIPMAEVDERQTAKQSLFESLGFKPVFHTKSGYHVPDDNPIELEKFTKLSAEIQRIDGRVFKTSTAVTHTEEPQKRLTINL